MKRTNIQLYAVEWNPNGTNDLLVVDGDTHEVLECIPEALFGYKRTGYWNSLIKTAKVVMDNSLFHIQSADQYVPNEMYMVGRISRKNVAKYMAVSPVDPEGARIQTAIKQALKVSHE